MYSSRKFLAVGSLQKGPFCALSTTLPYAQLTRRNKKPKRTGQTEPCNSGTGRNRTRNDPEPKRTEPLHVRTTNAEPRRTGKLTFPNDDFSKYPNRNESKRIEPVPPCNEEPRTSAGFSLSQSSNDISCSSSWIVWDMGCSKSYGLKPKQTMSHTIHEEEQEMSLLLSLKPKTQPKPTLRIANSYFLGGNKFPGTKGGPRIYYIVGCVIANIYIYIYICICVCTYT